MFGKKSNEMKQLEARLVRIERMLEATTENMKTLAGIVVPPPVPMAEEKNYENYENYIW